MSRQDVSPDLLNLINSYFRRSDQIGWLDWLPLAEIAAESPEKWVAAFNTLSVEKQYDYLDLLRDSHAGPLADTLLAILAQSALEISDEQVRDFILEDAQKAHDRTAQRLQVLAERVLPLKEQVAWAEERLTKGFDLGQEITRLEAKLAELRARECGSDEEFARVHALEREIIRLETRRRILASYDTNGRIRYREELQAEVEAHSQRKDALERTIAEQIVRRDTVRREVAGLLAEQETIQAECDSGVNRVTTLSAAVEQLKHAAASAKAEVERIRLEHSSLLAEIERQEHNKRESRTYIEHSRTKLEDLQREAAQSGFSQVEAKIREVYSLLPPDQADGACR